MRSKLRYVKWGFYTLLLMFVVAFLHYTLPQHDVVRIVGTQVERQDLDDWTRIFWSRPDDQSEGLINRDVQFIYAIYPNGKEMVYRNEDTGWSWPPYFKFDTSSLFAQAQDAISTVENPRWYVVTHYGWRNEFLSTFPNAVAIRPASGPDERVIPWVSIVILVALAIVLFLLRRMWLQFRERAIDPALQQVGDTWDEAAGRAELAGKQAKGVWGRLTAWLGTWRRKPRP